MGALQMSDSGGLLAASDFVSLHCPRRRENRHLIDTEKPALDAHSGAFLINTARGDVVDQDALIGALERGEIAGAGPRRLCARSRLFRRR